MLNLYKIKQDIWHVFANNILHLEKSTIEGYVMCDGDGVNCNKGLELVE